jgi:hypothetical protein
MPWKCPVCHDPIRPSAHEDRPSPNTLYRCHICRIELVFDVNADKMIPAPIADDETDRRER